MTQLSLAKKRKSPLHNQFHSQFIFSAFILLMLLFLMVLHGCGTLDETSDDASETCDVTFHVAWPETVSTGVQNRALSVNCDEVDSLTANIYSSDNESLKNGGPWDCSAGQGTISNVPAGSSATVEVSLYNTSGEVLYKGISLQINLIPGQTIDAGTINTDSFIPTLLNPAANSTVVNGNVTFQWAPVNQASEYEMLATNTSNNTPFNFATTNTNYQTHDLISQNTEYGWQVRAVDKEGNTGAWSAEIRFTTDNNNIPTAIISTPGDGSTVFGEVQFSGSGDDIDDGSTFDFSPVWTSSIDGQIGTALSFIRYDLTSGKHTITLTVTDSVGAKGNHSITTTVIQDPIVGQWTATSTGNWTEGECPSNPATATCNVTYDGNTGIYTMVIGNEWDCNPTEVCTLKGPYSDGQYDFGNSISIDGGGLIQNSIPLILQQDDSYSGTATGSLSSPSCQWGYTFTLTKP